MPEVTVRRLICDGDHDVPVEGRRWKLDDGRRNVEVILCDTHAAPLLALAALGRPAPRGRRAASPKGLSPDRLDRLVRDDDK